MTLESSLGLSLALFVSCALPGPGVLAVTARSLVDGLRPAIGLSLGMALGDLFYLLTAVLGLAAIGRLLGDLFFLVRIIGAAYLVFLGLRLWFKPAPPPVEVRPGAGSGYGLSFLTGFAISLGNPKVILFYLGFLPSFIDLTALRQTDILLLSIIVALVISGTLILYALAAARVRHLFKNKRAVRIMNRGAGAVLIGAGLAVAADS